MAKWWYVAGLCWALVGGTATACIWDSDTLLMEKERFPGVYELLIGQFLHHSPAYYQWRLNDRLGRIAQGDDAPGVYDDLAVSYDKLGRQNEAIAVMQDKLQRYGALYETYANLGTFYVHNGEFEQGIYFIKEALALNPEAHFGRERYQLYLAQYLLEKGDELPLNREVDSEGFAHHVLSQPEFLAKISPTAYPEDLSAMQAAELRRAIDGVAGMMHFGNHTSPILLEAMGDLLVAGHHQKDGKMLAFRAYLAASWEVGEGSAVGIYRQKAERALLMHHGKLTPEARAEWRSVFRQECQAGAKWWGALRRQEERWISLGENPETRFMERYYASN